MLKHLLNRAVERCLLLGFCVIVLILLFAFASNQPSQASSSQSPPNAYPSQEETPTPDSFAYPGPEPTVSPTSTPITSSLPLSETAVVSVLRLNGEGLLPDYEQVSSSSEDMGELTVVPMTLNYDGPLPSEPSPLQEQEEETSGDDPPIVNNWEQLAKENFDNQTFPGEGCIVADGSDDGYERYWAPDDGRYYRGTHSGWPAKGGADGVDPDLGLYPSNLSSWLVCGPFDLSQIEKFMLRYAFWIDTDLDGGDGFFVGVSLNGTNFYGSTSYGFSNAWINQTEHILGAAGDSSVWVAWAFWSDEVDNYGEGVWLDSISVWTYETPEFTCGSLDPGNKGIVLPPYNPGTDELPMIHEGDTKPISRMNLAGVDWVRLGFVQKNGLVDLMVYDRMIDTLCANGISVLGLVNHETLVRQDYNDPNAAAEYRQEFSAKVSFLSGYYEERIKYWEVWNEPNYVDEGPFMDPVRYAPLLSDAFIAIKAGNPQAKVLYGGLASAWGDSNDYFTEVYQYLVLFGLGSPFDYFAVHPYPRAEEGPNPEVYMYAVDEQGHTNILDKFLETMWTFYDEDKTLWITEAGWNSSKGSPNRPLCLDPVLVYETEQEEYLTPLFDILFNEVTVWNDPNSLAVEKVVWYQYMDIGIEDPCNSVEEIESGHVYVSFESMLAAKGSNVAWSFGLFRADKEVTLKPVMCAYLAYPLTCSEYLQPYSYLPTIRK